MTDDEFEAHIHRFEQARQLGRPDALAAHWPDPDAPDRSRLLNELNPNSPETRSLPAAGVAGGYVTPQPRLMDHAEPITGVTE